jgi:hypothetical protein
MRSAKSAPQAAGVFLNRHIANRAFTQARVDPYRGATELIR